MAGKTEPLRVLVVDDGRDSARVMAWMVEAAGHEARTAHDGTGAIAAAAEYRPHAVLMDVTLPDISGTEAARRIRSLGEMAGVLIVGVSGHRREDVPPAELAAFDYYVRKPVRPADLASLLTMRRLAPAEAC